MKKKNDRHQFILHEVHLHNRILLSDIAESLGVSKDTVRRDIQELHEGNKLKKVHGGAISTSYDFSRNQAPGITYAPESKMKIVRKALRFIKPNSVNLISGGTTNLLASVLLFLLPVSPQP